MNPPPGIPDLVPAPPTGGATVEKAKPATQSDLRKRKASSLSKSSAPASDKDRPLTDAQKTERRERNREHAKRSRLRKKFLLESLQEQINGLQSENESLKSIIRAECGERGEKGDGRAGDGAMRHRPPRGSCNTDEGSNPLCLPSSAHFSPLFHFSSPLSPLKPPSSSRTTRRRGEGPRGSSLLYPCPPALALSRH